MAKTALGMLAAAVLVASACSSGASSSTATTAPGNPQPSPTAGTSRTPGTSPVSSTINFDKAQLQATVDSTAKDLLTPGAVAIVRTPQGEFATTYGTTTFGGSTPVAFDNHVRIGSVTKTFTGTVTLQLAQDGKLSLDDPVSKYRPDVPNGQNITITQLLNMRSGLFNYSETKELNESLDKTPGRVWTPDDLLALAFKNPPYFPPGQGYHYSNTNTVLLGLIAEQLDAKPLATIFQDRLFTPLKMKDTSFPPSTTVAIPDLHPQGYQFGTNVETMESPVLPPDQQAAAVDGTLKPNDVTDENPSWTWAAGQAISTADDLATWAKAETDGTLLNPQFQELRLDSPLATSPNAPPAAPKYGLGIGLFGTLFGHTGELPGFNNIAVYDPAAQVTVVVWANLGSSPDGQAVATTIGRALIADLYSPKGSAPAGTTPDSTTPGDSAQVGNETK